MHKCKFTPLKKKSVTFWGLSIRIVLYLFKCKIKAVCRMNRRKTDIEHRRKALLEMIRQANGEHLDFDQLSSLLKISPVTLRRDLSALQEEGLITRGYGKVAPVEHSSQSLPSAAPDLLSRIAMRAAQFVESGDIIFLNTSRTALQMLRYIEAPNVTVITNNVLAINSPHRSDMTLILTGGEVRYPKYAMVGDVAQRTLQSMKANKAFLGCSGLSVESGMTTEYFAEASVNNLMLTQLSGPVYMLATHTKLGMNSNFISGDIRMISNLITDRTTNQETVQQFRDIGMQIYLV